MNMRAIECVSNNILLCHGDHVANFYFAVVISVSVATMKI